MGNRSEKKKGRKSSVILIVLCLIFIAGLGCYFGYKYMKPKEQTVEVAGQTETLSAGEPVKQLQIFSGTDRPVACMIDNSAEAWPQYALNDAYMVYEIVVEGQETRLMALYKGKQPTQVGPMRSSRHYFLDYALENDAIYAHIGWSPQAQKDIKTLGVNNINGLAYDTGKAWKEGDVFWRISGKYKAPHNCLANVQTIKTAATKEGYSTTSSKESVLNYVIDEESLETREDAVVATDINIPISPMQKVDFKYDATTKRYTRYARGKVQTDATTNENVTTKNIIITFIENYTLNDGENKGRQGLKNTGSKKGYYITNGYSIPITCTKDTRAGQTVYRDSAGNEINVNDGNTFVEICPPSANVTIK